MAVPFGFTTTIGADMKTTKTAEKLTIVSADFDI